MKYFRTLVTTVCFVFVSFVLVPTAQAATYTVTKTAETSDGNCNADCSFLEAVTAANANAGHDTIEFNIPTSDGGYVAPSGSTQGYWSIVQAGSMITLTDDSGVFINGYSQPGSSRNTAAFGEPINTVLTIEIYFNIVSTSMTITGDNNHFAGISLRTLRTVGGVMLINGSSNNWLEGNFFGTNITGMTSSGGADFILQNSSNNNTFGTNGDGTGDVGERNLFSGSFTNNTGQGYIGLDGNSTQSSNIIAGNYMGTDKTGRVCTTKTMTGTNMQLSGTNNRVGTNYDGVSDTEEANIMGCINSVNARSYIKYITPASGNFIQGNFLGISPQGDNLGTLVGTGRGAININFSGTVTTTVIKGNTISNADYGIISTLSTNIDNTFSQNSIFGNAIKGISLSGSTFLPNDAGDVDTGANNLMNYPVLQSACRPNSTNLYFIADLDFQASEGPFTIEFFANDEIDSSGYGEGKTYLGSTTTAHVGSSMPLTITLQTTAPNSPAKITATATNASGATSEFSAALGDSSYDTSCVSSPTILPETYSQAEPGSCTDFAPVGMPDLFQILRIRNSAVVFFTPVLNSTRSYLVMYGFKEGEERYGASLESLTAESNVGVQKLAISDLDQNQEYWFKVAPKNGCATGEWSNWMRAGKWQGKPKLLYK